jgi:hypothetical protein
MPAPRVDCRQNARESVAGQIGKQSVSEHPDVRGDAKKAAISRMVENCWTTLRLRIVHVKNYRYYRMFSDDRSNNPAPVVRTPTSKSAGALPVAGICLDISAGGLSGSAAAGETARAVTAGSLRAVSIVVRGAL